MNKEQFNKLLASVERIEIYYGGFILGFNNVLITVKEDVVEIEATLKKKRIMNKEVFMNKLKEINIGAWKHSYKFSEKGFVICDGYDWSLDIYYNNGTRKKHYQGDNDAPENFDALLELVGIDYE